MTGTLTSRSCLEVLGSIAVKGSTEGLGPRSDLDVHLLVRKSSSPSSPVTPLRAVVRLIRSRPDHGSVFLLGLSGSDPSPYFTQSPSRRR